MGRKLDISGLPLKQQEAIWAIMDRPKRVVNLSGLDNDTQDKINHVLCSDAIQVVRQGLLERKHSREQGVQSE